MWYSTANEFNVLSWDTSYCQEMHDFKLQDSITWIGTGILFQMSTQVIQCHPQMLRLLFSLIPCVCLFWELNFDMYSSYMIQWLAAKCQLSRNCAEILKVIYMILKLLCANFSMQRLQMAKWEIIPSVDLLVSVEIDHVRYLIHFGNTCIFWPIFRGSRPGF